MAVLRRSIIIATRGSRLALWQAHWVKTRLETLGLKAEFLIVETQGDREQKAFHQLDGQGFFTKAVQEAVLAGHADMAVHSLKDLPSKHMPGLTIAAVSERADPREVLLVRPEHYQDVMPLPLAHGITVGTSAARRRAQLKHLRPDLAVAELRGNVPTRLEKLYSSHYDAIMLAAAGLQRLELDLEGLIVKVLEPEIFVPAPGQGALALDCRKDNTGLIDILQALHHRPSALAVKAERGLMAMLEGGCQLALGAFARLCQGEIELTAWYQGRRILVKGTSPETAAGAAFAVLGEKS